MKPDTPPAAAELRRRAGDAPDLHRGHAGRVRQDHGHLQNCLYAGTDPICCGSFKGLGTVAALQQERLALGCLCQA